MIPDIPDSRNAISATYPCKIQVTLSAADLGKSLDQGLKIRIEEKERVLACIVIFGISGLCFKYWHARVDVTHEIQPFRQ